MLSAECVMEFGIVALVAEQSADGVRAHRLNDCRHELRCVDAWPYADVPREQKMRFEIANRRQLRISDSGYAHSLAPLEVPTDVAGLKPGSVDGSTTPVREQTD